MIYAFLAEGFEETEAIAPIDILKRCGKEVVTVGIGGGEITGAHGITVVADITDSDMILTDKVEMIVLPGGMPGTLNLEKNEAVQSAVSFCAENGKYIGAICAAPSILGKLGLLDGKKATCFPGFEQFLTGAEFTGEPVNIDGNIITARGAGVAVDFGLALAKVLCGEAKAEKLRQSLRCI